MSNLNNTKNKLIEITKDRVERISQGDIYQNVEIFENYESEHGNIKVSIIKFPLMIVLSQDCDLLQDYKNRLDSERSYTDKFLFSILVAPLYNLEHVYDGSHLNKIDSKLKMAPINKKESKTENKNLKQNQTARYHYLEFQNTVNIVPSVIDFKHFFTVNRDYLYSIKNTNFVCKISELYREDISLRFSNYLSRIGLPD